MKKSNDILIPEFERLLHEGHSVEFCPQGISMRPFLEGGRDRVVVKSCHNPQVGFIVLAKIANTYVLHRIYHIKGQQIILRGDGNLMGYEVCLAEDIIGYVVQIKTSHNHYKCVHKAWLWRHMPTRLKEIALKIYRKLIIYM